MRWIVGAAGPVCILFDRIRDFWLAGAIPQFPVGDVSHLANPGTAYIAITAIADLEAAIPEADRFVASMGTPNEPGTRDKED